MKLVKDFRADHLPPKALIADMKDENFEEPNTFKETIKSEKWKETLVGNKTSDLVPFDSSMNLVGCK